MRGGAATEFSFEEKVVGTWIDGKPLYQKTFTGTLSGLVDKSEKVLIPAADLPEGIDISEIKIVGNGSYVALSASPLGNRPIPFIFGIASNVISCWPTTNGINIYTVGLYQYLNGQKYYITIQYTKTTD